MCLCVCACAHACACKYTHTHTHTDKHTHTENVISPWLKLSHTHTRTPRLSVAHNSDTSYHIHAHKQTHFTTVDVQYLYNQVTISISDRLPVNNTIVGPWLEWMEIDLNQINLRILHLIFMLINTYAKWQISSHKESLLWYQIWIIISNTSRQTTATYDNNLLLTVSCGQCGYEWAWHCCSI